MTASASLQVMGLAGDTAQDAAIPVPPVAEVRTQLTTVMNAASRRVGETLVLTGSFYQWLPTMASPGTLNLRPPIATTTFTITP